MTITRFIAIIIYELGVSPTYTAGIKGGTTYGYGKVNKYGQFMFELHGTDLHW